MNLRRLKYFIKIVDVGSLTQAADILHIAQPALSQQLATLEERSRSAAINSYQTRGHANQRRKNSLYPRSGDSAPMRAGAKRHRRCRPALSGQVSVGLAPGTAAQLLAIPLLTEVQRQHPGIVLYFNENFGTTLSELIMSGRMDMAVIYGDRDIHGLRFLPLMKEELFSSVRTRWGVPARNLHGGGRPLRSVSTADL